MTKKLTWIAEIGNNHNGDFDRAIRLIDESKKIGCNIVKFQLRDSTQLYRDTSDSVEDLGVEYTKDLLKKYELPFEDHVKLAQYCNEIGIEYMCTPWDRESLKLLETLNVKRYKIASADFDNIDLIKKVIETGKELILSTGMAKTQDIIERCNYLKKYGASFTLLHCNSTYPAPFEDIELNYLKTIKKYCSNIGYSGHERGIAVSIGAVALGAKIIERHITEDRNLEGPDHQASLLPSEFEQLIRFGEELVISLGQEDIKERKLSQGTLLNKEILGKSLVAKNNLEPGHKIQKGDLLVRSPGQGLPPTELKNLVGKILTRKVKRNDFISYSHINKSFAKLGDVKLPFSNWGIPVRPHDVLMMHDQFYAPVYEFHISYKDLDRKLPDQSWEFLTDKKILVHAPELFADSKLLDLTNTDEIELHLKNINRVCDFSRKIRQKINTQQKIRIITNIGGFSTHSFRQKTEIKQLYKIVANNLQRVDEKDCEITIQNMAPFPWHFGGQRFQNIFADPDEILEFCNEYNRRITLDTAHLSMYCTFARKNFSQALKKLEPVITHWHMSDAQGTNGEGVKMGNGDVDFFDAMKFVKPEQTFIVETWQGHKDSGEGFKQDLKYLERKIQGRT